IFFDDAPPMATLLELTLTAREGGNGKVPMCGVPYHAVQGYIARLVKAGKKVAICEQLEDSKNAKGLVKREVTRVVTPSTFIENDADANTPLLGGFFRGQGEGGRDFWDPNPGLFPFGEESAGPLNGARGRSPPSEIVTRKSPAASPAIAEHCEA